MSSIIEILISLMIVALALGILLGSVSVATRNYMETEKRYLAILTAENVLHTLASKSEVPDEMNGFEISYEKVGKDLTVHVDKWIFKYEVSF